MSKSAVLKGFCLAGLFLAAPACLSPAGEPLDKAADFCLFGVDYRYHRLSDYLGRKSVKAVVVVFTANHCPVSGDYEAPLAALARKYQPQGFPFIAVSPNPAELVPEDGFPEMVVRAREKKYPFPYVYDETQETARAYGAVATPEIFVVGRDFCLLYAGAVDEFGGEPHYLADALEDILAGRPVGVPSARAIGCLIEYRRPRARVE